MKNNQTQLLTYYSAHRCSSEDTQDLYLGFEELKPVLSLLNRIQICQKKYIKGSIGIAEYFQEVDTLKVQLENVLYEDVENQIKKEKK